MVGHKKDKWKVRRRKEENQKDFNNLKVIVQQVEYVLVWCGLFFCRKSFCWEIPKSISGDLQKKHEIGVVYWKIPLIIPD